MDWECVCLNEYPKHILFTIKVKRRAIVSFAFIGNNISLEIYNVPYRTVLIMQLIEKFMELI